MVTNISQGIDIEFFLNLVTIIGIISLTNTTITLNSYTTANITVNMQGQITFPFFFRPILLKFMPKQHFINIK